MKSFCDKKFFSENVCLSHMGNLSVASSEALIQNCSLTKYGASLERFSFRIAVLNIFWKFPEKRQQRSSYLP